MAEEKKMNQLQGSQTLERKSEQLSSKP